MDRYTSMSSQNEKPYKCTKCQGYDFDSDQELKQHDKEHHSQ